MNGKKSKLLKKLSKKQGLPYKLVKRAYTNGAIAIKRAAGESGVKQGG